MSNFCKKMAKKNEVKNGYPPPKTGIIQSHTVASSSAFICILMISCSDNIFFDFDRVVFVLSFKFNVTQNYSAAIQTLGQRRDLYSVNPHNASFWRGVAMFDLIFLNHFFTKLGSFCIH